MVKSQSVSQKSYFWDYVSELSLQCILDKTLWINGCKIEGTQKLGSYIQILKIYSPAVDIEINGCVFKLEVGGKRKVV